MNPLLSQMLRESASVEIQARLFPAQNSIGLCQSQNAPEGGNLQGRTNLRLTSSAGVYLGNLHSLVHNEMHEIRRVAYDERDQRRDGKNTEQTSAAEVQSLTCYPKGNIAFAD
jgi:hypothetical protein